MTVTDLVSRVPRVVRPAMSVPRLPRGQALRLGVTAVFPLVLLIAWSVGDALQPAPYSAVRQTISVAAGHAGTDRWVATAGLLAVGIGYLISAVLLDLGPYGRAGFVFTGVCGLSVALLPEAVDGPTTGHQVSSVVGALALALGPAFTLRKQASWRSPTGWPVALVVTAVFVALNVWLVYELNLGGADGLAERITSNLEVVWPFIIALGPVMCSARRPRKTSASTSTNLECGVSRSAG